MSTLEQIFETTTKRLTRHTLTRRYGDKYNEVFEQQMIIIDTFFSYCAKDLGNQIKNCHHLHWFAHYWKLGFIQLTEQILFRQVIVANQFQK